MDAFTDIGSLLYKNLYFIIFAIIDITSSIVVDLSQINLNNTTLLKSNTYFYWNS